MKRCLLVSILFLSAIFVQAQKETDHWFFGVGASLDFTGGAPVVTSGVNMYSMSEGNASISTGAGALLFYTDGTQIWDASHTLMPNGSGLAGDISTTQSSVIIPKPASATQYYVFTLDSDGDTSGLRYSIVDMSLNGGMGDVTAQKNIAVEDSMTEKMCAIRSTVGGTYWILTHRWNTNEFYAYELTSGGLQPPVISSVGMVHNDSVIQNTYGQMKFNNCGTKVALAIGYQNTIEVFDFNQTTGVVSNPLTLPQVDHVYGVEFSPNSDLLYVSTYDISGTLLQYNISLGSLPLILASRTPLTVTPDIYALQLASDGKIYCAKSFSSSYIGCINSPNTTGSGCNYVDMAINLDTAFNGYLCALGLPNFVQNYLKNALSIVCPGAGMDDPAFSGVGVYPNPTADEFYVDLDDNMETLELSVIDCSGKIVWSAATSESYIRFGKDFIPGIYFLTIRNANGSRVFKLLKT